MQVEAAFADATPRAIGVRLRPLHFLAGRLAAERDRWLLWLPVGFGFGIALYFSLDTEPWPYLGVIGCIASLAAVWQLCRSLRPWAPAALAAALALAAVSAGFAAIEWQTSRVVGRMIDHPLGAVTISGRVSDIEVLPEGTRVTIAPQAIEHLSPDKLPQYVRIKLRGAAAFNIGDGLTVKAELMPPAGPALPGGFDFQRQAWFRGLGAVGYAFGTPAVQPGAPGGLGGRIRALRAEIAARIRAALPGAGGSIAAALVTGERGAIPAGINQDYRDSGLSHLLVIAGLHMTLVSGFVFFAVRAGLALIPALALHFPIKKWAALAALSVATLYLVISGAAVPTQRAYVMVAFGLVAILIDRLNISMITVAWAAGLVLILDPSALLGVSFQMSFAAVIGLIAFYETAGPHLAELRQDRGAIGRWLLHLLGIGCTTLVATLATATFSIYHFNRFAIFSILANLVAVPLAGLWVMPWAVASCLLMPLGLEGLGLTPMGWGLDAIEWVAHWTSTLPFAVLDLPAMPNWGLVAASLGGLWLTLWRTSWRYAGLALILLGALSPLATTPPDILAAEDGGLLAIRSGDGGYLLSSAKADKLTAESWLRAAGHAARATLPEPGIAAEGGSLRCDEAGCLWRRNGHLVALVRNAAALAEDCRNAELLIALIPVRRGCRATTLVVDRTDLRHGGAVAIWLDRSIILDRANDRRGERPWVLHLGPRIANAGQ